MKCIEIKLAAAAWWSSVRISRVAARSDTTSIFLVGRADYVTRQTEELTGQPG